LGTGNPRPVNGFGTHVGTVAADELGVAVAELVGDEVGVVLFFALLDAAGVGAARGRMRAALTEADDDPDDVGVDPVVDDVGVPEPDDAADGVEVGVAAVPPQATTCGAMIAPRMLNTAALLSAAMSACALFGMSMMSWLPFWMATVDSVTPVPFTRLVMICFAWVIEDDDGLVLLGVLAVKVTSVPPTRSMPSLGVCRAPGQKTIVYSTARIRSSAKKYRPTRSVPTGGATGMCLLGSDRGQGPLWVLRGQRTPGRPSSPDSMTDAGEREVIR
jgi:hypothetical protein